MFRLVQAITVPYDVMQHCFDRNMISMFIATTWINMYSSNETAQTIMLVGIPWIATRSIMHRVFVYLCVCVGVRVCELLSIFFSIIPIQHWETVSNPLKLGGAHPLRPSLREVTHVCIILQHISM